MEKERALTSRPYFRSYTFIGTFEPLFEFILFAISLAALTYPVFYRPILRGMRRILPRFPSNRLSELSAVLSTLTLRSFHAFTNSSAFTGGNEVSSGIWRYVSVSGIGRR